jgi:predicted phage baseplate assembly protein
MSKETCGCCAGIEPVTPQPTANRPGLDALAYRVGTHATFLATMKARLSNICVGPEGEVCDGEKKGLDAVAGLLTEPPVGAVGGQPEQSIKGRYPLQALTTRAADDPAIALLDGWATVGDVLTFYQERIANEGYLRPATERRSILELARLVGYRLRFGVASSVYLAFTLENDQQTEIPPGTRAQSLPGPDELPQPFETAEPLPARAEWNALKPRLTQSQSIDPGRFGSTSDLPALYIEGFNTNLKANDPLLFLFGTGWQRVHRIQQIEPDAAAARTKVTLQTDVLPIPPLPHRDEVLSIVDFYLDLTAHGVASNRAMVIRVTTILQELATGLETAATSKEMSAVIIRSLIVLRKERAIAAEGQYRRLLPWVSNMIADLEAVLQGDRLTQRSRRALLDGAHRLTEGENGQEASSALAGLFGFLPAAAKAVSSQPANPWQLAPDAAATFKVDGDIAPRLLTALSPQLKPVLYKAWQQLPLTEATSGQVMAFRTRASVFGHNAAPSETISIDVHFEEEDSSSGVSGVRLTFKIGSSSLIYPPEADDPLPLENRARTIEFDAANETITFTISEIPQQGLVPMRLQFAFSQRPITADGYIESSNRFQLVASGSNPTALHVVQRHYYSLLPDFTINGVINGHPIPQTEQANVLWLDAQYEGIVPGSWVVLQRPSALEEPGIPQTVIARVTAVSDQSRADYGLPGLKSTRLSLDRDWFDPDQDGFEVIRGTAVYVQSELLPLAPEPIADAVCGQTVDLERLYDGLEAGRWLIVSGERTDIRPDNRRDDQPANGRANSRDNGEAAGIQGIPATELVMLAGVEQVYDPDLPDETARTRLHLASSLAYCYKRDTVTVYGNVVKATHGETRREVLGSGDGSRAWQQFVLKKPPLTYLSAANPSGAESTLTVRVNDVRWQEAADHFLLTPKDKAYILEQDNEGQTTVTFGGDRYGSRLPTGAENVTAVYRSGMGREGNVKAGQISLLATRPLGVKEVINPQPATGGAGPDSRDQARRNAPLAVMALDRLVSVQDYADFARTFAGIGKASAARLSDGQRQLVHLTIAGAGDIPIAESSDLYRNLRHALHLASGDPYQPLQIALREQMLLIIVAGVCIHPDYLWEKVAPQIRHKLLDTFSFEQRDLGQDVTLSEVASAIQSVPGVVYADVDLLQTIGESDIADPDRLAQKLEELAAGDPDTVPPARIRVALARASSKNGMQGILPAQLAYLSPDVPDTLLLRELAT